MYHIFFIAYVWDLKKKDANELIYIKQLTHRHRNQIYGYQKGKVWGKDKLEV